MTEAVFVVSKQPYGALEDGETQITRLLVEAAARSCSVRVLALAGEPARDAPVEVIEVPKPPARVASLAIHGVLRRRSLIHSRFAPPELVAALEAIDADVLVARRLYMAEAAIAAGRVPPRDRLLALADVLESSVLRARRSALRPLYALEARRTRRDEIRCARAASQVAFLSDTERDELRAAADGPVLDLVLPAAERPAPLAEPVAVFVGDRRWPPNAEGLERLMRLWPEIAAAAPGARLLVVGREGPGEPEPGRPEVERLGFVEDLDALWRSASVLLAPVATGGGVRVKVLDAARHGVPVAGSPAAIGSTGRYLPVRAAASDEELVSEAALLLRDSAERRRRGAELYEANRELSASGFVEGQLAELLTRSAAGSRARG